jgi:hypothetical protein
MKFDISNYRNFCVASDTDSCFFEATPQLKKRLGEKYYELPDNVLTQEVQNIAEENSDKINIYLNTLSKKLFNVPQNRIEFKTETIIKSAYWSGKRRYAQYIVNKEGIPTEEFDIKGLDIMKSNFPPYFREFGEELIKSILFSKPKEEIDKFVMDFKDSIYKVEWKKLLKPVGLKKLDEYIERKPTKGEIFSKLKLKCPVNTKAAIITNDLLRFKKITKQYPEFTIGDKIYIAALKPNPYKIEVVALNGYNDAPEILEMVDKYIDRDGLFDSIIRNKLHTVYSDIGWQLNLNHHKSKFFNFS